MSHIAEKYVESLMSQVAKEDQENPGRKTIIYSSTITDPDEVKAGEEITALFEKRLREYFQGADISVRGYGGSGYNIQAQVKR